MEHQVWIFTLIQADRPGCEDCLFSALGHLLDHPGFRVEDRREPEPIPQQPQNIVDQHPQALPYIYMSISLVYLIIRY